MKKTNFHNRNQLNQIVLAIADLLKSWGFADNEWMLGKNASLYYLGMIKDVTKVERDLTIYVVRDKLPWLTSAVKRSRSTVAPAGSRYAHQHYALERLHNCGIDLTPIPDVASPKSWVTRAEFLQVGDRKINIESPVKYVARRIVFCQQELALPAQEVRDGYFVDEQRYKARMAEYTQVKEWAMNNEPKLVRKADRLIKLYDRLVRKIYPEIFSNGKSLNDNKKLVGRAATGNGKVQGHVIIVKPGQQPPKDRVLIFSHFSPRDNHSARSARAIVTDGGGALTHAAILCRELNVPCVVGTKIATKVLRDGDMVEVNADKGIVKKLS